MLPAWSVAGLPWGGEEWLARLFLGMGWREPSLELGSPSLAVPFVIDALEAFHYSQTEAAEALHIPLSTLNQKIKRLEIPVKKKSDLVKADRAR